jgi:hypothetical protein
LVSISISSIIRRWRFAKRCKPWDSHTYCVLSLTSLGDNRVEGTVPSHLGNLISLERLNLGRSIPAKRLACTATAHFLVLIEYIILTTISVTFFFILTERV